jgi:hypothetical protein
MRRRSMAAQILLTIVTFGIYSVYWFYSIACELRDATGDDKASPALWTVLLFVPFGFLYSFYKFGELYEKWSPDHFNRWLTFVLYLVFSPAVWFIVQSEANRQADKRTSPAPVAA